LIRFNTNLSNCNLSLEILQQDFPLPHPPIILILKQPHPGLVFEPVEEPFFEAEFFAAGVEVEVPVEALDAILHHRRVGALKQLQ